VWAAHAQRRGVLPVRDQRANVARRLLVWDGSDRLLRVPVARVAALIDDLALVRWQAPGMQSFLEAQFGG